MAGYQIILVVEKLFMNLLMHSMSKLGVAISRHKLDHTIKILRNHYFLWHLLGPILVQLVI